MALSLLCSLTVLPKPRGPLLLSLPALEVMTMTVFSKFTVRPWASVMRPSSRICKQDVQHIGVGLFDLVKQHHGVGLAADLLGQLARPRHSPRNRGESR